MKRLMSLACAVALLCTAGLNAAEIKSGPVKGDKLSPFEVVKCAGEKADTVEVGKRLCYRCKNGSRPQVIVFTRSTGEEVTALVKKLDAQIKKNEEEQLRAFVNVMGESKAAATTSAKKLAKTAKTKKVPYVVPVEFENGPDNYGLNPKAEITIVIGNENEIVTSLAYKTAKDLDTAAVLKTITEMLN